MQGTNTTIFVEDHRSLFEEIVFVCINCMYVVSRICIQTRWSSQSLVEEINISRHIAASLLLKTLNWVLSKNCNRFTSNMAQAIQSFEIPWGGVKLNRQQRISILFNILFWSFYFTQIPNCDQLVELLVLTANIKKLNLQDWNMEIGWCVLEVLKRACQSQKSSSKSRQRAIVKISSFGVLVFITSSIKHGFISIPLGYH